LNVGYVRVSSPDQKIDRQTDLMEQLGVEKIYIDKLSGKNADRPELKEMLSFLREGDTLIVESISRLARNVRDLLELIEKLDEKGVKFISKKEHIDTSTPTGKLVLTILGAIAEMERETILERQAEGIHAAQRRGVQFGRPPAVYPENWESVYVRWKDGSIRAVEAMRLLGLKKTKFYDLVKSYEKKKNSLQES